MKRKVYLIILILLTIYIYGCKPSSPTYNFEIKREGNRTYLDKAYLEEVEGIKVLFLSGSPYLSGYQHGKLLSEDIKKVEEYLDNYMMKILKERLSNKLSSVTYKSISTLLYNLIYYLVVRKLEKNLPEEYIQELKGISEGAGVSYKKLLFYNFGYELAIYGITHFGDERLYSETPLSCTSIVCFKNATSDNVLYHSRNLDWEDAPEFIKRRVIIIQSPSSGIPFVNVTYAGFAGVLTGMNMSGISLSVDASFCQNPEFGIPTAFLLRKIVQYAEDLDTAEEMIKSAKRTIGNIVVLSDGKEKDARIIEFTPFKCESREGDNFLFATNHFIIEEMKEEQAFPLWFFERSTGRFKRLEKLIEDKFGRIDLTVMIDFLRDRYNWQDDGINSYCPQSIANLWTNNSVVFVPESLNYFVANNQKAPAADGEFIGFNLREQVSGSNKVIKKISKNPYINTRSYQSFKHYIKGKENLLEGKKEEGEKEFIQAKREEPTSSSLYYLIGSLYLNSKDYDNAINNFQQALALCKDRKCSPKYQDEVKLSLATAYFKDKNFKESLKICQEILQSKPNLVIKAKTHLLLGKNYKLKEDNINSRKHLQEVIRMEERYKRSKSAKIVLKQIFRDLAKEAKNLKE